MYQTIIKDNFFENAEDIVKYSKTLKYHKPTKNVFWFGKRTESLHTLNRKLFDDVIYKVVDLYHPNTKYRYYDAVVCFTKQKHGDKVKSHFHRDDDCRIAAVVYLTEGDINGGTTLFDDFNKKQIIVGHTFNSMIAYDGNKLHGFTSLSSFKKRERLTLNVFIRDIEIL